MKSGDPSNAKLEIVVDRNDIVETLASPQGSKVRSSVFHTKQPPSWELWCERNSKPVKRPRPHYSHCPTRWQKAGPMTKKEWKNFYGWALERALPRERELPKPEKEPCPAEYMPCGRPKRHLDKDQMEERMMKLATPRKITEKYKKPDNSPAYSPMISWGVMPHRDPGRPFKPPRVPCCFPNDEIEAEFWSQLRFRVRRAALLGQASPRLMNLSKPRIYPTPRRPIGPLDIEPPPRKKFTRKGWQQHQLRLLYLSQPVSRTAAEFYFYTGCLCCAHNATGV
ncbi:uncharacterized protein LOC110188618 [Drosophila serrata]|uniref:uncharacterized protein LOC110188618 n=1 Tax=Drosophila serrata TaxID=7274 RepID=UPI000A1D034D|nr:uncharacterized protein LOC110188618 [Drosophila serrata]